PLPLRRSAPYVRPEHQHQARPRRPREPRLDGAGHPARLRRCRHGRLGDLQCRSPGPGCDRHVLLLHAAHLHDVQGWAHRRPGEEQQGLRRDARPAQDRLARVPGVPGPLAHLADGAAGARLHPRLHDLSLGTLGGARHLQQHLDRRCRLGAHRVLHRRAAAVHEPGLEDEDEVGPPGEDDHWYARCREGGRLMTKAAITTIGAALLAAAALALSGCSYPGDDEDRTAFHAEALDPVPSAPATEPTEPETPAEETGDESTEEGGKGEKSGATADLGVEDGHVQYLRAIQNFSPALERWVLDEEAGEVTDGIVNCAGQTKSEGVATLERVDGGDGAAFEATWIGKSPLENVAAESIRVEITEDTLKNFADVATSRTDIEASNFASMCAEVGETAADLVF